MKEEHENTLDDKDSEVFKSPTLSSDETTSKVAEEEFAYFIIFNSKSYLKEFKKFNADGVEKFRVTWNWPAFLFSYVWMASRKMYIWSVVAFGIYYYLSQIPQPTVPHPTIGLINSTVCSFISVGMPPLAYLFKMILFMMLCGMTGNYLYYRHTKKRF